MARSRKYTKVIQFYQVTETADGYGGYTVSDELIAKSWCNIKTASSNRNIQKITDIGITDVTNTIIIQLRYRNDIKYNPVNQYIKYNGDKYIIQNYPTNINLENVEVEIIATKEMTDSVEVIDPINV